MGLPPALAWDSGAPFPSSRPHGSLVGRLKGKFASRRANFGALSAAPRSARLVNSAAPSSSSHGPPGTGFPRDKRQTMPCGQQVWEQRRVPRGGGSVGRAGTAAPVVACPSPAPGHVCVSRVGSVPVFTRGFTPEHPQKGSAVPLPRISPISPQFSVFIYKHPAALHNPAAPPGPVRCFRGSRGGRAGSELPWERCRGAVTPLINLPVAATCAGESRRGA